ncbi:MAG TPA: radical SAM family heme chaperone HemW [Chloroflexi bacterium]|nr:radical SAM family heme chaperone HemW [Chloroflexota bacterium]
MNQIERSDARHSPAGGETISLYIHIPFCRTLCTYCAFNRYTGLEDLIDPYVTALLQEMKLIARTSSYPLKAHTLYLGGGTPSLLAPEHVASIIAAAQEYFHLAAGAEVSLEANPGERGKLSVFRSAGVTRLSLGVQSTQPSELRLFGRRHTVQEAAEAFRLARAADFASVSIDLIYGAPWQTLRSWHETLRAILAWAPDHISLYSLSIEPGTALYRGVQRGVLPAPDPDLAAAMYEEASLRLEQAGLKQYEISNWARPGHECQHNCQYWRNAPYLGFGAGAHGSVTGLRYWNVRPVPRYLTRIGEGVMKRFPLSPAMEGFEVISKTLAMAETMILGLRLVKEGVRKADFAKRFGQQPEEVFGPALRKLERAGLLMTHGDAIRLTKRAYLISNRVFVEFLPEN